jgi:hypothetical protein
MDEVDKEQAQDTGRLSHDILNYTIGRARELDLSPAVALTATTKALGIMLLSGTEGEQARLDKAVEITMEFLKSYIRFLQQRVENITPIGHA